MAHLKSLCDDALSYLPGLLVLAVSMFALHSSLVMIQDREGLIRFYKQESKDIANLYESSNEFEAFIATHVHGYSDHHEKVIRDKFNVFAEVYFEKVKKIDQSPSYESLKQYDATIRGMEGDVLLISNLVGGLSGAEQEQNLSSIKKAAASLHEKIENLWVILYSKEQAEKTFSSIKTREFWVYWSVIILGLFGFILVLLNTDKLRKLKAADRQRQEAFKLSQQHLAAMESTLDGIGIVNADGELTYMNRAFMNLYMIDLKSSAQFIGNSWEFLHSDGEQVELKEGAMLELEKVGYWRGIFPILRQDGTTISVELSLTRLLDGGVIGTVRDITEKLEADREKEELQGQFYQAQKMEAVGRLAGGIAHDFNNILAAMNGYAEFLIEDLEEGSTQHSFAKNILQAGTQARSLVDQMLAFSRHEKSEADNFDLVEPINESLLMLQAIFPKTIEIKTDIQVNSALINGNTTQISQLIMNLCVNAKDAMEEGGQDRGMMTLGVHIADTSEYESLKFVKEDFLDADETPVVRIEDVDPGRTRLLLSHLVNGQQYIMLSVRDNGGGMSRVIMEHIFEPFFTTKPVDKGTGLGLATVHGVISKHHGAMIVDSTLGEGTLFKVFIPLAEECVAIEKSEVSNIEGWVNAHIHLVEDQEEVRDMMLTMLQRLGYEATYSTTGLEALEYLKEAGGDVDLVITDYNMPKMTGLEMASQVSLICPGLPFVLLSGYSEKKLKDLMEEHPAIKAILRKPVSRQSLSQKIEAVLAENSAKKHVA